MEMKDRLIISVLGNMPEEAHDNNMDINIVDDSLICIWNDKEGHYTNIYKIDVTCVSQTIESIK